MTKNSPENVERLAEQAEQFATMSAYELEYDARELRHAVETRAPEEDPEAHEYWQALRHYVRTAPATYRAGRDHYIITTPHNSRSALEFSISRVTNVAHLTDISVPDALRGMGAGRNLYQAMAALLRDQGLHHVTNSCATADALLARRAVFGTEPMTYHSEAHPDRTYTFEQAVDHARKVDEASMSMTGSMLSHLRVDLDLSKIDSRISRWEVPKLQETLRN